MEKRGDHAVVLGASMDGLLAARVLADFYDRVTVVAGARMSADPVDRRGVPQSRLIHAIQARGIQILDELFPGFVDELTAMGVESWEGDLSTLHLAFGGHQTVCSGRAPHLPVILCPSRPVLEWNVRRRVQAITNVVFLEGSDVVGLTATPDRDRVTGAWVTDRATDRKRTLRADLVVDATGRGSRTPVFLEELGYRRPPQNELVGHFAWRADMLRFAADFVPARVLEAIRTAERLGDVVLHHRVPSNRWRRYDKMRRRPDGLLVVGDAVCSFNPIYGRGMTVAAIEATVLRDCLRRGDRGLTRRFFRLSARKVRVAWQTAVGPDLTLPELVGPRPISMRITNAYLGRVMTAAETDPVVAGQFMRVTSMVDSPIRLLRPSVLLRVLQSKRRPRTTLVAGRKQVVPQSGRMPAEVAATRGELQRAQSMRRSTQRERSSRNHGHPLKSATTR